MELNIMSSIKDILLDLSNDELAILVYCRYQSLLVYSRQYIDEELRQRGLDLNEILNKPMIRLPKADKQTMQCKKCGSERFHNVNSKKLVYRSVFEEEVVSNQWFCLLCNTSI